MKKLKLFFACLLMTVLSIGQVWAADVTSKMDLDDQSPAYTASTTSYTGTESATWTLAKTCATQSVGTESSVSDKYYQIGSGSKSATSMTWTSSSFSGQKIKQVVVKCSSSAAQANAATVTVTATGGTFTASTNSIYGSTVSTLTFNSSNASGDEISGDLEVALAFATAQNKNIRLFQIDVIYDGGGDPDPTLESIVITGTPDKTVYEAGENFDPTGLVATGHYDNSTTANITSSVEWAYTPAGALTQGLTSVNVTATKGTVVGNKDVDITVNAAAPKSSLIFTAACGGSGTADDGVTWTVTSDGAEAAFDNTKGVHYGTGTAGTGEVQYIRLVTDELPGIIKKVVVNASTASGVSATVSVTVGGSAFGGDAQDLSTSAAEYTFAGSASGEIVVLITKPSSATKAIYCKSIVVSYEGSAPKPEAGLAYDAADAQKLVKVGGTLVAPTPLNPNNLSPITYSSDNTSVVEVNENTGAITIKSTAGKAVITASTEETSEYKAGSASYTIFVAEQAGTEADPLTEASAKSLIDDGCTLTVHVNGLVLSQNATNFTVTLTNGFQFYKAKDLNNVAFESAYLGAGDEVTAVGALKKFSSTYELDEGCYLTFYEAATTPLTPIANDQDHPYTVEQALVYAAAPTTYDLSDVVYVRGKVAIASTALFSNKYLTYSISDDGTTTSVLKVYNGLGIGGAAFESKDDILVGDVVVVKGNLTQYNTELELAANNELVSKKPVATIAIDNMVLEYAEEATISATITPAAAASTVVYSIKAGSDDVITLVGDEITAKSATGTATIVATIASTDDYEGVTKEFTVSVSEGDTRKKATLTSFAIGGVFDVTDMIYAAYQGDAANPVYISGTGDEMRLYKPGTGKTTGGYIVINAVKGCTIDEVIVYNGSAKATTIGCSTTSTLATSGEAYAKSASVSFKNLDATVVYIDNIGSDRMDIKKIEVFYTGDAAAVDHYELGGTYQTEFEIDDEFNHDGLVVYMAYDAGGTEKLEITPACTFSEPDMSVAGTPTVNITFAGGVVKTYDITVAASTLLDPELSYDPTSVTLTQGDALSAPTLNNPHTLDLTFNSNKTSVATVDEFGVIALAGGTGTATITASFAGDATYQAGNATFTITVNEPEEDLTGTWEFATSVAAGDRIIIASIADAGAVTTMGAQNGNNRSGVASTVAGTELTPAAGSKSVTLVDAGDGKFAFQLNNGSYLYASSNSGNQLKETAAYADNENAKWTISISEGVATITAQGTNSHNLMRFNPNSGSPLFNCYTSSSTTGTLVTIYKKAAPVLTTVREGLSAGRYYTICYPKAMTAIKGGTLWSFVGRDADFAYIQQESAPFTAGKPYLIYATAEKLEAVLEGEDAAAAGHYNGLYGTLSYMSNADLTGVGADYLLKNNELHPVGTGYLDAQRAYIIKNDIPEGAPAHAPGKNIRSMPMHKDATTGIDDLNASDAPRKMVIDGTMFILRGEKLYDATGRMVK